MLRNSVFDAVSAISGSECSLPIFYLSHVIHPNSECVCGYFGAVKLCESRDSLMPNALDS